MILLLCVIGFVVFSIVEASGKDWEAGQRNADRRTRSIISAIHNSSYDIEESNRNLMQNQVDYLERLCHDTENEEEFQDSHGRWFRRRLVYNERGQVVAEELVGVER